MSPHLLEFGLSLSSLFLLLCNVILYFKKRTNKDLVYKMLLIYLSSLFVIEVFCHIVGFLYFGENFFISHFYFNAQFLLLSMFFHKLFQDYKNIQNTIICVYIVVSLILLIQYILNPDLFWKFNLFEIGATSFILIAYSLLYIYKSLGVTYKYYYLLSGLIIYLLCSSVIFLSGNYELVFFTNPYIDIWIFNTLFYIVYQVLIHVEWRKINNSVNEA